MNRIDTLIAAYQFNRTRTLGLLEAIDKLADPSKVLGWRPGPARAHIGWQLMHIAITEEIFATERLAPQKAGEWPELWPNYRGGSTPDDHPPTIALLRVVLNGSRSHLLATLSEYSDDRLNEIPAALAQRGLTVLDVLHIIAWHEAHHQGQAHLTLNLYKAANGQ